jgi:hypothetical protein
VPDQAWQPVPRDGAPAKIDVVFAFDTTGSMGGEISNLKASLSAGVIPGIRAVLPDVAFGLVDFRDFGDSWVVRLAQRVQTVATAPGTNAQLVAVNSLAANGGGDAPEAGWEAMYSIAGGPAISVTGYNSVFAMGGTPPAGESHGTIGGVGFRANALPIVIAITDAEWHDAPGSGGLNEYPAAQAGVPSRAQAIGRLNAIGARVISVVSSGGEGDPRAQGRLLAQATGALVSPAAWEDPRPAGCAVGFCCTGLNGAGEAPSGPGGSCPLVYSVDSAGTGLGSAIVDGVETLLRTVR